MIINYVGNQSFQDILHCRVPVQKSEFDAPIKHRRVVKRLKFDETYEVVRIYCQVRHSDNNYPCILQRSMRYMKKKEERFPCPDCEEVLWNSTFPLVHDCFIQCTLSLFLKWYGGDTAKIQLSCRHKRRQEPKGCSLKQWDISFPDDY